MQGSSLRAAISCSALVLLLALCIHSFMSTNSTVRLQKILMQLGVVPFRISNLNKMANKASWIPAPTAEVFVGDADTPTPGPGELLVKIKSIAFSPIESKIQKSVRIAHSSRTIKVIDAF
jgi:hypothetical protein